MSNTVMWGFLLYGVTSPNASDLGQGRKQGGKVQAGSWKQVAGGEVVGVAGRCVC